MQNRKLLEMWVKLFNEGNAKELSELYLDEAINHQIVTDPVVGKKNILKMFEKEFKQAEMVCIPESIYEDKDWIIMEWSDPKGFRGCGFFQIQSGKIKFQRGYVDTLSFYQKNNMLKNE